MKEIKPLDDRVLVEVMDQKEIKTASGFYLPDDHAKEKPQMGKVVAIGDSNLVKVKLGESVLFAKFSGSEIKFKDKPHLLLQSSEILARVTL